MDQHLVLVDYLNLRKTVSDKVLHDKEFNIAKNPRYDGYLRCFASMFHDCFDNRSSGGAIASEFVPKQQLTEELHKPIIKKFEKT